MHRDLPLSITALPLGRRAVAQAEGDVGFRAFGPRQGLDSSIFTLRILSPGLRPSTTSIPEVTWPKTV